MNTRTHLSGPGALIALPCLIVMLLLTTAPVEAQNRAVINQANWQQLEKFSSSNLSRFTHTSSVGSNWINETDSLWYRWADRDGVRWHLVEPKRNARQPLFDHEHMAEVLATELRDYLEVHDLPISSIEFEEDGVHFTFEAENTAGDEFEFRYNIDTGVLTRVEEEEEEEEDQPRNWRNHSPDSLSFVYAEEHNLYFVEIVDGEEQEAVQLSDDGEQNYSFGSRNPNAGQRQREGENATRVRPSVSWADDSRAFYVTRSDSREVRELFLVNSLSEPRPTLESYRYAMPGEDEVTQVEFFIFDRGRAELRQPDVARWRDQRYFNMHWTNGTSEKLRLVRRARTQRDLELIEIDTATDEIRVLIHESVNKGHLQRQNARYLEEDNAGDFIWFSRRTGWGHYYLYDHEGELKNPITRGNWNALSIVEEKPEDGLLWVYGVGREEGENPYYRHYYRVPLDGSSITLLDSGEADHRSSLSPSGRFLLNNRQAVDLAPSSVIRDWDGNVLMELEEMDLSELYEFGWKMPETFKVKAADGVTDIYGNIWKPFDFDPEQSYPIIAHVYPGPQTEQVRTTFSASNVQQELAQLGFIVIQIGNRGGNPLRSAAYHSYGYFDLRDYGLADKRAGIQELAKRHSWIDVNRVGIYGHSGGGFMSAAALLVPPYNDFFKVAVSSAGNHDNNVYNQNWSEQHHGLAVEEVCEEVEVSNGNGGRVEEVCTEQFEIHVPANHEVAENLKGNLLLVHGDMDNNVHHAGTMRLARELIRNDKRFDMMIFPGMRHGFGGYSSYFQRMLREYFAEHLIGDYYRANADATDLGNGGP